jgi:hypothetical protein
MPTADAAVNADCAAPVVCRNLDGHILRFKNRALAAPGARKMFIYS